MVETTPPIERRRQRWLAPVRQVMSALVVGLACFAAHGVGAAGGGLDKSPGLRGFNLGARSQTPFADKDYADLAAYGANVVRIGVNVPLAKSGASFDLPASEWAYMERTVAMGRQQGFKVILALVPIPLGDAAVHWDRPELKASLVSLWAQVAARFRRNPVIAGYDLINEPVTPRDDRRPAQSGDPWRELAMQMIQAIRAEDADSIVIFEPSPWGLPKGFAQLTPLPFAGVVYSFHFYEPHALTHQGLYEHRAALDYPSQAATRASLSAAVEPVRAFARKYAVPIFVGEFSIVRWAPGDSAARYLNDAIDIFEAEGWGWAYHSFREYEGWDAELDPALARGTKGARSAGAKAIRLLVDKGFSKNPPAAAGR